VKLHHAALLAMSWYLLVPTTAPTSGEANAAPSPTASIWNTYKSHAACEADRQSLLDDPVIGARMVAAKCLQTRDEKHPHRK